MFVQANSRPPAVTTKSKTIARNRRKERLWSAIAVLILAFLLFPLYWMVNASFQSSKTLLSPTPALFPTNPSTAGYESALQTQMPNLAYSLAVALCVVVVTLLLATPASYALAKRKIRGSSGILLAIIVVQMIPGIVMANALYLLYAKIGLLDTFLGLVLADVTTSLPFSIIVIRAFMMSISDEILEAATVDGASSWRTFVAVVLPLSRNSIITAGLFAFLHAWSDFLFAVTLAAGGRVTPITVGIYRFVGAQTSDWGSIMATATLASIPAIILLVIAQKYIAAGLSAGATKG